MKKPNRIGNLFAALITWLLMTPVALAQQSTTLGEITQAARRTSDKSREALISIFGEVVNDPLAITGSGGDTILASIFMVTNGAMLVIGAIFTCYILFNRLSNTAHDGALFDRDKVTLWEPIRVVWGLATLVPTVNGWSLAQLLMLWAASVMGVGVANLGVDAALAAFNDGKSMVAQPPMPSTIDQARELFKADLCMAAINKALNMGVDAGTLDPEPGSYVQQTNLPDYTAFYGFALKNASFTCGSAMVGSYGWDPAKDPGGNGLYKIDYMVDTTPVVKAHATALQTMQSNFVQTSQQFVNDVVQRKQDLALQLLDANKTIHDAADRYEIAVTQAVRGLEGELSDLAKKISDSIKDGGWWMLGSWYQTFAQANSKIADAINGKLRVSGTSGSGDYAMGHLYVDVMRAFDPQVQNALNGSNGSAGAGGQQGSGGAQSTASSSRTADARANPADTSQAVTQVFDGFGQEILNLVISPDADETNPIIRAKNLGDYLMVAGEIGIVASAALNSTAGKAVALATSFAAGGPAAATATAGMIAIVDTFGPMAYVLILALFFFGATLAIYVPLAPFIVWFGAIINWLVVVGEAVVAAPLWAMIHLAGEGDGFGHKTSHGYIFLLNCMVRPILMVIGFFLGGAIVIVGGKVINELFMVAVANSQFDSVTGFVSIIGFIAIYCFLILNLIHSCFNLIFIVPDQVINWVGGHASPALGRDENDKARMGVAAMIATGQGALGRIGKAGAQGGWSDRFNTALAAQQKRGSPGITKG